MSSHEDVPFVFLLTCSETSLRGFAANCCNQIAELKKARRELNDDISLWEGRRQFVEKLIGSREEIFAICRSELRQQSLPFAPVKSDVRRRVAAA